MKTNENSKLNQFKLLFISSLAIAFISFLSFLFFVNKYPSHDKGDSFAIGAFFGAFFAFSIVTGVILLILQKKNKSTKTK